MTQLPTLGSWLSTLDEGQLTDVIDASPLALAGSRLRSVDELAQRLSHPASVASTLCEVPLPVLEIVEAASALGEAASATALADLLDTAGSEPGVHAGRVAHWLGVAQRAALLWIDGERLRINPGVDAMVTEPLTIGRPARMLLAAQNSDDLARILKARHITTPARKAERLEAALAAFSDPSALRRVAARAPEQVLQTLADHVSRRLSRVRCQARSLLLGGDVDPVDGDGIAYYVDGMLDRDAYQRERDRGEWAKAAGLAAGFGGWSYHYEAEMPSEVFLALAPPSFRAPFHADPPPITLAPVAREQVRAGSAAALAHFVAAAMTIFEEVARGGLQALKRGGIGTRELARLAKHVREDIPTVRLALELGLGLELFGLRDDGRIGVSSRFDPWRRRPPHRQAFDLVSKWLLLEYAPTAEQDESGAALPALGRDDLRTGVPNGLLLITTIASATQPGGTPGVDAAVDGVTSGEEILDFLVWNHPTVRAAESAFVHTWTETRLLGVVADGAVAPFAQAIVADDSAAALTILERALPAHSAGAMFGSDLTVVVPGNPAPDVADVLTIVADREGHGAANIWRASAASVRSALDSGYVAADLVDALRGLGGGALPQAWEYLIADTARKHGRMRVAGAAAVITCQDEALLAEAVASRALRTLGLSLAAPTVAISRVAPVETLRRLREAGFLPVEVDADGAPVVTLRSVPRAVPTSDAADEPQREEPVPQREEPAPQQQVSPAQIPVQDEDGVIPLFADDVIAAPWRGDAAESARDLASRLLSGNPDSNPRPGEVNDIADVERRIAHANRRLSPAEVHELADAETRVRPVVIRYRSQSGRESVRMVSQLNLVGDNLFAFCHLRDEERVFRLDRIIEVAPTY